VTAFWDTNIFVYAFITSPKQQIARRGLMSGGVISVQVLNEFANVMTRKMRRPWEEVERFLAVIRVRFPIAAPLTMEAHAGAVALARDHSIAFYDALILASALSARCTTLYSEDLPHGRRFGDCVIVNPFLENPPV
jgi:predicted nucleic acid-binding protein